MDNLRKFLSLLRGYGTLTIRGMLRHKMVASINVIGLSIGIACSLLALAFASYHASWDNHHPEGERVFRVLFEDDKGKVWDKAYGPLAPALQDQFPEVEAYVRINRVPAWALPPGGKFKTQMAVTEPSILDMFDYDLISGDARTALDRPFSVIITESAALTWFGTVDVVGQTLPIESYLKNGDYKITGVTRDLPPNTTYRLTEFDIISTTRVGVGSAEYGGKGIEARWNSWMRRARFTTFVKLRSPESADLVAAGIPALIASHLPEGETIPSRHRLQPLTGIHLHGADYGLSGDTLRSVYLVTSIASLILLVACINFVNLSTARASVRQKEIGIRKASGALRGDLFAQFTVESLLITSIASVFGVALATASVPLFRAHSGLDLPDHVVMDHVAFVPILIAVVGLLAGIYPSLVLSAFHPARALKSRDTSQSAGHLRKALTVTQFAACIVLVAGTVIMQAQTRFLTDHGLGFDHDLVITMPIFSLDAARKPSYNNLLHRQWRSHKARLTEHPNIVSATVHQNKPGLWEWGGSRFEANGRTPWIPMIGVDETFADLYGVELIAGRGFDASTTPGQLRKTHNRHEFIVNEAATRSLGFDDPQDAIGQMIRRSRRAVEGVVVGVMKDFHVRDLRQPKDPLVLFYDLSTARFMSVKIKPERIPETLVFLEAWWDDLLPERPFMYAFLDEEIGLRYTQERQTAALIGDFSIVGILLGCLGLFGLTSFAVERRVKEIGIRKSLGAGITDICYRLSRESGTVLIAACIIAWPIGFYLLQEWLTQFVYRIDLHAGYFILSGLGAAVIAFLTVSLQAVPAARANPVESLRHE